MWHSCPGDNFAVLGVAWTRFNNIRNMLKVAILWNTICTYTTTCCMLAHEYLCQEWLQLS